jgi:xanthine dehydrogenase accessory factor
VAGVILLLGGGDLASGVALRLHRAGLRTIITELPQPLAVRRLVSFAEAVYTGQITVEEVTASHVESINQVVSVLEKGQIPVLTIPWYEILIATRSCFSTQGFNVQVLIDARMMKLPPEYNMNVAPLVIGLGPGFVAGENSHAVIETQRGHFLGRVIWQGPAQADSGIPESVAEHSVDRVLRAPLGGIFQAHAAIGDHLEPGEAIGEVASQVISAPFAGRLRGLLHPGIVVEKNAKIGDLDPRDDLRYCTLVSDKALAVGGGALEAILRDPDVRCKLWDYEAQEE